MPKEEKKCQHRRKGNARTHDIYAQFLAITPPCSRGMMSRNHARNMLEGGRWWLRRKRMKHIQNEAARFQKLNYLAMFVCSQAHATRE